MTGHHHHDLTGAALAKSAQSALEATGEQWTAMRAEVFDALAANDRPMSAYDLTEAVSSARGKRVAANSVYRILDLFVKTNVARKLESANAFIANTHPQCAHDCIYLICDNCGSAVHMDDDSLATGVMGAARAVGFTPERPVIEVRGRCAECAAISSGVN